MSSEDRPVRFTVEGDAGFLPATVATPLSVVLNELLQNAIDHAFPPSARPAGRAGSGRGARCANDGVRLQATVVDDGVGLPDGFSLDAIAGLGLSIVRTLVTSELVGTISLERGTAGGDRAGHDRPPRRPGRRAGVTPT